ncbi:MAG TPA: phosphotransferase [Roseiflexaceae bacterium]|nr:phosphotransferase [Roseiflexaceae bacterium]
MIPDPVLSLLHAALPGQPVADVRPTVGGFSNLTLAATVGGRRCVLKAASHPPKRADLRREAAVLPLLRGTGIPAPELLAFAEDQEWTVALTALLPGAPGLRLYERPPAELLPVFAALGRLLAAVHATTPDRGLLTEDRGRQTVADGGSALSDAPPAPEPGGRPSFVAPRSSDLALHARAETTLGALAGLPLEAGLHDALAEALAHPAWRPAAPRLVHGDAGLHNILWDGHITGLLDWEWAGWGAPALDLAWVAWTMRFRGVPPAAWEALLASYADAGGAATAPEPEALRALALGQIAGILVRSYGRQAAWEEWLRRARWTREKRSELV